MDYKQIEQLLERYWLCETTLEEEAALRHYFTSDDVPAHLRHYRTLFLYQERERSVGTDSKFLSRMPAPVVKARRLSPVARLMPLCKAAAIVAVVLSVGTLMQHSFFGDECEVAAADTIGRQISAPSVALNEEVPSAIHSKQLLDSLKQSLPDGEEKE